MPITGKAPTAGRRRSASCCAGLPQVPGIVRLRYMTSHPRDMDDDLIAAHGDLPALMPYVHLPVQSGSDRILAAMNRRHTRQGLSRRDRALARQPRRSRLHLGFHRRLSGRDRRRFPRTRCRWWKKSASPPPTPSCIRRARARRPPPWRTRSRRPNRPNACNGCRPSSPANGAPSTRNSLGRTVEVLLEKPGKLPGQLVGRTPYLQAVQVMAPRAMIGSLVQVAITEIGTNTLFGALARAPRAGPRRSRSLSNPLAHIGSRDPGRRSFRGNCHHADRARLRG